MITLREYSPGEAVFREGDEGGTAYIIDQGQVVISKQLEGQEVHLARLGAGEIFGEMSLIEERPRSATARAVARTVIREIPREEFTETLHKDPHAAMDLLKVLFERLREANATILQLQKESAPACRISFIHPVSGEDRPQPSVSLEGLTPRAIHALPANPFHIPKFPFRIGRTCHHPLVTNDLMIPDSEPFQVSIHHISFVPQQGGIGLVDRGSRLGSLLNGKQLGGKNSEAKPATLSEPESILILGGIHSPYKYKVVLHA